MDMNLEGFLNIAQTKSRNGINGIIRINSKNRALGGGNIFFYWDTAKYQLKILKRTWKLLEGNIKYYIILLENSKIG